jgi:hypothetical protein
MQVRRHPERLAQRSLVLVGQGVHANRVRLHALDPAEHALDIREAHRNRRVPIKDTRGRAARTRPGSGSRHRSRAPQSARQAKLARDRQRVSIDSRDAPNLQTRLQFLHLFL